MRRLFSSFIWPATLFAVWTLFVVSQVSAAGAKPSDDGVAEFIRTHPGYHGYLTPHPPYPLVSRAKHESGDVTISVTFAKAGQVSAVKLVKSSGFQNLDGNTINYIKARWRSTLGRETTVTKTLEYSLRQP